MWSVYRNFDTRIVTHERTDIFPCRCRMRNHFNGKYAWSWLPFGICYFKSTRTLWNRWFCDGTKARDENINSFDLFNLIGVFFSWNIDLSNDNHSLFHGNVHMENMVRVVWVDRFRLFGENKNNANRLFYVGSRELTCFIDPAISYWYPISVRHRHLTPAW